MTSRQGNVRPIVETVISPSRDDGASIASPSNDAAVANNAVITPDAEDTLFHEVGSRQESIPSVMQPRNCTVPASTLVERRHMVQSQSIVAPSNNSCPPRIPQSTMNPGSTLICKPLLLRSTVRSDKPLPNAFCSGWNQPYWNS